MTRLATRIRRPSPALVVAFMALLVAMSGTAVAASIANNAVKSRHIQDGQVKRNDIRANAVNSDRVASNTLTADDLDETTLTSLLSSQVTYRTAQTAPVGNGPAQIDVACQPDEKAIGGSGAWVIPNFQDGNVPTALEAPLTASMPIPADPQGQDATGWRVAGRNLTGGQRALRVYVLCVPKAPLAS